MCTRRVVKHSITVLQQIYSSRDIEVQIIQQAETGWACLSYIVLPNKNEVSFVNANHKTSNILNVI